MFLVDDVLLFPMKGILSIFREIHKAAQEEMRNEAAAIRNQLSELYILLESGGISDAEFERRETELLDRLDIVESRESEGEEQEVVSAS